MKTRNQTSLLMTAVTVFVMTASVTQVLFPTPAHASFFTMLFGGMDEHTENQRLIEMMRFMEAIDPWVERPLYPRFYMAKHQLAKMQAALKENGQAHTDTINERQKMVVTFKFSERLFNEQLNTPYLQTAISGIYQILTEIKTAFGLNDTPYTKVLEGILRQLKSQIDQVQSAAIDDTLKAKFQAMVPSLGKALAVASEGDTTLAYQAAKPIMVAIRALYPQLNQITAGSAGFDFAIEIQGLTEYCFDYAKDFRGVQDAAPKGN